MEEAQAEEEALREAVEQQEEGDMPGEDEPEWQNEDDPNYNPDEYIDDNGDGEHQDSDMDIDEEQNPPGPDEQSTTPDQKEPWENQPSDGQVDDTNDPNGYLHDKTIEREAGMGQGEVPGDVAAVADVHNEVMDTGSEVANAAAQPEGFQANEQNAPSAEPSFMDKAIGGAVDLATGAVGLVTDVASGALDVAFGATKGLVGGAADLASSAMNALTGGGGQQQQTAPQQQQSGGLFSAIGNALNGITSGV